MDHMDVKAVMFTELRAVVVKEFHHMTHTFGNISAVQTGVGTLGRSCAGDSSSDLSE